jgi:hypothetical protein
VTATVCGVAQDVADDPGVVPNASLDAEAGRETKSSVRPNLLIIMADDK